MTDNSKLIAGGIAGFVAAEMLRKSTPLGRLQTELTGAQPETPIPTPGNVGLISASQAGDKMDLVDAPNATAITAVQNGLQKTGVRNVLVAWSAKSDMIPSIAFTNTGANKTFPSVIVPASFLPVGYALEKVYAVLKYRKLIDSSGSVNSISAASKTLRVKLSTGAWGTDDIVAITFASGSLSVLGNATEGGDMLIGTVDVKSVITSDGVAVNFASRATGSADAIVVTASSLTMYDVETALLYVYTL